MSESIKLAIDLLISSAQQVQSWMNRFMVVNGALLTGIGFIISWSEFREYLPMSGWILVGISVFGATASYLMAGVTIRQIGWNAALRKRIRELQGEARILPEENEAPPRGFNHLFAKTMQILVPVMWGGLALVFITTWRLIC